MLGILNESMNREKENEVTHISPMAKIKLQNVLWIRVHNVGSDFQIQTFMQPKYFHKFFSIKNQKCSLIFKMFMISLAKRLDASKHVMTKLWFSTQPGILLICWEAEEIVISDSTKSSNNENLILKISI